MAKLPSKKTAKTSKKTSVETTETLSTSGDAIDSGSSDVPDLARIHIWQIQAFRDVLLVAAVWALFTAGYLLRAVTVPLLLALMLAYVFEPLVARWSRTRSRKIVLVWLIVAFSVVVGLTATLATTLAVGQAITLSNNIKSGEVRSRLEKIDLPAVLEEPFKSLLVHLPTGGVSTSAVLSPGESADSDQEADTSATTLDSMTRSEIEFLVDQRVSAHLADPAEDESEGWLGYARGGAEKVLGVAGTLVGFGFLMFLVPFYFFFFSLWYPDVTRFARGLIPSKNKDRTVELLGKMDAAVSGFVRGRIVISLIMGVMLAVGWSICGVPYAFAVGMATGVFCAVPYLGAVGMPAAIGLLFFDSIGADGALSMDWWWIIGWPVIVFAIVQIIEGYVLTPMIAGKATNLDPVTILVAVLAGGSVLGVYGMLLAIPAAACGKILITDVLMPKVRAWVSGKAQDPLPID